MQTYSREQYRAMNISNLGQSLFGSPPDLQYPSGQGLCRTDTGI